MRLKLPSELPSGLQSELPSDLQSDWLLVPSDLPSDLQSQLSSDVQSGLLQVPTEQLQRESCSILESQLVDVRAEVQELERGKEAMMAKVSGCVSAVEQMAIENAALQQALREVTEEKEAVGVARLRLHQNPTYL